MDNLKEAIKTIHTTLKTTDIEKLNEPFWNEKDFNEILDTLLGQESVYAPFMEDLLSQKFRELLRPFDDLKKGKTIYCKCEAIDADNDTEYVVTAMTKEMINVDLAYFGEVEEGSLKNHNNKSVLDLLYKPYYYSFVYKDKSKSKECFDKYGEEWREVKVYSKRNKQQESSEDQNADKISQENTDSADNTDQLSESNYTIPGYLGFAASPYDFATVEAEWGKEVDPDIKKKLDSLDKPLVYKEADNTDVDNELNKVFDGVSSSTITVYRVGEANAVMIKNCKNNNSSKYVVFDLGLPNDCNLDDKINTSIPTTKTESLLRQIKPDVFIVSHWHLDHVKAAFIMERQVYAMNSKVKWLAPLYINNNKDFSADRLVKYLVLNNQILFVKQNYKYTKHPNYLFRINATSGNDNDNCLVLVSAKTVFPGDCKYLKWIKCIKDANKNLPAGNKIILENIIAPHHGAEEAMKDSSSNTNPAIVKGELDSILSNNRENAVMCTGKFYGHPDNSIESLFNGLQFKNSQDTKTIGDPIVF